MATETQPELGAQWLVEVFYDGDCPLCLREIKMLRWLDRRKRIRFTDIAASDFSAEEYGKTMDDFMNEIRGRFPSGEWIVGVEVFRQLYSAVGFKLFVWPSRMPGVSHLLDLSYRIFAKHRLRLTGRCTTQTCEVN